MDMENRLVFAKGERGVSGMEREFGASRWKPLHLECISYEVLLYRIGENIYKRCNQPGIKSPKSPVYTAQYQKTKQPSQKMGRSKYTSK